MWLRSNVALSEIPFLDFSSPTYSNMTQFVFLTAFPHVSNAGFHTEIYLLIFMGMWSMGIEILSDLSLLYLWLYNEPP